MPKSRLKPRIDATQAKVAMSDIAPNYTPQQAKVEAERCLYCFDAPCIQGCPTGIDIPGFIGKIAKGNLLGSARVILEANPLGASCARVCPTEALCEGACVLLDRDEEPVKIGRLQRHATDYAEEKGVQILKAPEKKSGKKIAIIGGGPAGLACGAELAQLGHSPTIFEKNEQAGGLNTYGIAYYKLTPEQSLREIEMIKRIGVEIKTNVEVGKDISAAELRKNFDAIFLGIGLGKTYKLGIEGEDAPEAFEALDFIEEFHTKPLDKAAVGKVVVVIGCGNTAIDAVTQAKRLGADRSIIMYRRGEEDMPAYPYEYELAKKDGCEFHFFAAPKRVILEAGHVAGIEAICTEKKDGKLCEIKGSEFVIKCDMLIKALGQQKTGKQAQSIFPELELCDNGAIKRDFATGKTNVDGLFAGGDASNGGSEVVDAVAEGKRAARGIHTSFGNARPEFPTQKTRLGVKEKVTGSGLDAPIRIVKLEKEYYAAKK